MNENREKKSESSGHSPHSATPQDQLSERRTNFADEEVPLRAARAEGHGRYDLSWDGVSGGCGTDEGY